MLEIKNIIDHKKNIQLGDIIRCCNSKFPYVEGIVDFMLVKSFIDADVPKGQLMIMVMSGYKSGCINTFYPIESTCKDGTELNIDWLINNWKTWGYADVDLNDVYIINKGNKYQDNFQKNLGNLESYKDNLERGQIINIPKKNMKFMIVHPTFGSSWEYCLLPISGAHIYLTTKNLFPKEYNQTSNFNLDTNFLRKKINDWLPCNKSFEILPKDILIDSSDDYPKKTYDLLLPYL